MEPYVVHVIGDLVQTSEEDDEGTVTLTSIQRCAICKRMLLNKKIVLDTDDRDTGVRYWLPGHFVAEGASGKQWLSHTDDRIENPCKT